MTSMNSLSDLKGKIKGYRDRINLLNHLNEGIKFIEEKGRVIDRLYFAKSVAMNINPDLIGMVYLSKGLNGIKVVRTHSFTNPIASLHSPTKEGEEIFLREVGKFLHERDTDWDELIIGVPRSSIILKYIPIPSPDERLIKKILEFEIERHLPMKVDDVYYDFQVVGRLEKNIFKVLIGAVKREFIDYYVSLLKRIHIEPTIADISALALCNLLSFNTTSDKGVVVLLNVEGREMEIDIVRDGVVSFSRGMRLDNQIKIYGGHIISNQENIGKLGDIIVSELHTAISSLKRLEGDIPIEKILLTGKLGEIKELCLYIEDRTKIKSEILVCRADMSPVNGKKGMLNRDKNVFVEKPSLLTEFSTAIGLGLRGMTKGKLNMNLLPVHRRSKRKDHSVFITLIMLFLIIILAPASVFSWIIRDRLILSQLERELTEVKSKASIVEKMNIKSIELENHIRAFNKLKEGRLSRLEIIRELTDILKPDIWLSEIYITDEGIEISGFANAASNLIQVMENSPVFTNVRFDGTITKDGGRERFKIKTGIEIEARSQKLEVKS
ncbi:MAG: pilus assembly protein PilM [Nitrospinae bacterium]|nr:pilus assembly protein PilM [Nitrospinota bacterium]